MKKIKSRVIIFAKKSSRFQFYQRLDIYLDTNILIININNSLNSDTEVI
jgi:hypothetical protein